MVLRSVRLPSLAMVSISISDVVCSLSTVRENHTYSFLLLRKLGWNVIDSRPLSSPDLPEKWEIITLKWKFNAFKGCLCVVTSG